MNDALLARMRPVTKRLRGVRFWRAVGVVALFAALLGWIFKRQVDLGLIEGTTLAFIVAGSFLAVGFLLFVVTSCSFRDPRTVAVEIEQRFPNLDQRLLTALSQQGDDLGYLQQRVVREANDHARKHRWADAVPYGRVIWSRISGLSATALLMVILGMVWVAEPSVELPVASRIDDPSEVQIVPGDTEVERGTSLVVTARFSGWVPDEADLICVAEDGSERRITMTQNLDDPVVGGFVSSVDQAFRYRVATADWESEEFSVDVFEFPSLVRSDANLEYPDYTGLDEKRVEDTVRVSAVEGTALTWICFLNKEVTSAELVAKDGTRIALESDPSVPGAMTTTFDLLETQRLKLELVDDQGRKNKYPPELVARVLPNQEPNLKLTAAGDASVSPLEEFPVAAEVRDDFGVGKVGLAFTIAGQPPQDITLAQDIPRGAKSKIEYMIAFEELNAEPDQLLSYHFWAEDLGPDGQPRRTESDMYFAEVRPFDEIFREGEAPPGGQQMQQQQQGNQNGQQAENLAELQKELINATWRVMRQERAAKVSEKFAEDSELLVEGQTEALAKLEELAGQIRDDRSQQFVDDVRSHMQLALAELSTAATDQSTEPLTQALASEQAAYAGLLRLRAREFSVSRQRQQRGGGGSASQRRRQRQLSELELDQDENRYETQQQAQEQSEQEQQERETRQVLNRLRELARRQEDLNKELAQLQSALEQAETREEQEEIKRQLKRLREQQQDLLRQTDELNERMQQPENQERMAEASEQLEQTRENVRRASEALAENNASEALTAGRRAEREFEEMRDEFRQQAAGQFTESVRQMREDARELEQREDQLAEQLREIDRPDGTAGLRGENNREQIQDDFQQQRQRLEDLLDKMQETVEQSETAEPLLAQKLYDSYRKTRQRQVDLMLRDTAELVRRGFDPQAREVERGANEGIDELRQELEDAASTVLGDETQALTRALSELERLDRDLNEEIRRNNAGQQSQQQGQQQGQQQPNQDGQPQNRQDGQQQPGDQQRSDQQGQQQGGQQSEQQQQQGQQQQGQQQQGQQQQGQQQQGQQQQGQQQQGQQQQGQQQQGQQQQGQQQQGQQQQGQQQQGQQQGQQQQGQQQQGGGGSPQQQQTDQQNRQGGDPSEQAQQRRGARSLRDQPGQQQVRTGGQRTRSAADSEQLTPAWWDPTQAPLTGDGFREWSDRLRDVEEMVDDPELRSQAARIRDRAREVRRDYRRHSKEPQWNLVEELIAQPLRELKRDVSEELLRRSAEKHAPVPIDRDPVPVEFADAVKKYYESLGSGR